MAGVWVEKATGVVYLPGLGFMSSPEGGRALGTNLHLQLTLLIMKNLLDIFEYSFKKFKEFASFYSIQSCSTLN